MNQFDQSIKSWLWAKFYTRSYNAITCGAYYLLWQIALVIFCWHGELIGSTKLVGYMDFPIYFWVGLLDGRVILPFLRAACYWRCHYRNILKDTYVTNDHRKYNARVMNILVLVLSVSFWGVPETVLIWRGPVRCCFSFCWRVQRRVKTGGWGRAVDRVSY